ncbi:MAG: hypothetical protein IPP48_07495 [Chitinophagaceae bacterium]|nr:hypothetical protein [Chitinophagaceae bacterium]
MKKFIKILPILALIFFANQQFAIAQKQPTKITPKPKPEPVNANITNNIRLTSKGFKVAKAYLVYEDETPVLPDNKVDTNQKVILRLIIDSGWTNLEQKAYPGASEKIVMLTGEIILKEDDLFSSYTETGVDINDAKYISLMAVITKMDYKKRQVIVSFKVWDKKGESTITGSYKLFIK